MVIGVLSDSHWIHPEQFDERLLTMLAGVDQIVHAGDVVRPFVLERLAEVAPVNAVRGNCDPDLPDWDLPATRLLEWEGVKIGLMHGHLVALNYLDDVVEVFDGQADLVIHGHIHVPRRERLGGSTIMCPGSVSEPRHSSPKSLALVRLEKGQFKIQHQAL